MENSKLKKKFNKVLGHVKTAVIILLGSALLWCSNKPYDVPDGKLLVSSTFIDSISNILPDTIYEDTVIYETKWQKVTDTVETLIPVSITDTTYIYRDSLENEDIKLSFKGVLTTSNFNLDPEYSYALKVPKIVQKTVKMPYPVYVSQPEEPYNMLWATPGLGIGPNTIVSLGLHMKNKKDNLYGFTYSRIGSDNYYQGSIGLKLKKW